MITVEERERKRKRGKGGESVTMEAVWLIYEIAAVVIKSRVESSHLLSFPVPRIPKAS